jgi:hypothetical protein
MADKNRKTRLELLREFEAAPPSALFTQSTIAALRCCSTGNIERDRWLGRGVPFIKIGHAIRYRKADYLLWERQYQPMRSTAEADAQGGALCKLAGITADGPAAHSGRKGGPP